MKKICIILLAAGTISEMFAAAETLDVYAGASYPGPGRRPDVELYDVKQSGDGNPLAYQRREVDWWPRKGVDIIEVTESMPLRTWTLRNGPIDPVLGEGIGEPTVQRLESLQSPQNAGNSFFRRITGFLHPPKTGEYTFMISADESAALYLSTDDKPKNKQKIAGLANPAKVKQWDKYPGQKSEPVKLEAGKKYYIEVTHAENKGGDHVEVGWVGPGVTISIVPGENLSGMAGKKGGIDAQVTQIPKAGLRRKSTEPRQFKAHLVGFRGIGNTMSTKYDNDGGPIEPGVVLRLPDGRKRCFVRGSFCEKDKQYIMDLYVREMNRIKAGLDKTKRTKRASADVEYPDNAKPGEPGTMQVESEHFIWLSGSQAGSETDPWINEIAPEKAQWYRDGSIECAEFWWAFNEYIGHLMPYWDNDAKLKYQITVPGTKRDGYKVIPGYAGGGYGGCGIKGAGGGPWAGALFHEWGHGTMANSISMGGGEAQADMHQSMADPGSLKGNHHIKAPWRNVFNGVGGYGFTMFYNITGDDPNWGYGWFTTVPYGVNEWSVLHTLARTGEQRGIFKNGIRGLGDMAGEYGARLATFDCELEDVFCRSYFAPQRSWLETVDAEKGIYRIPFDEAPEPFGVNVVRFVPDEDADEITVDFTGLHDPALYSDWRACIIAVGPDGRRRYSPLWNKGRMTLERQDGDHSYWLSVTATPTALYVGSQEGRRETVNKAKLYSGRHAYKYPWSVTLSGARPGTPRECRADLDDTELLYSVQDSVPAPADTSTGKRYLPKLLGFIQYLEKAEAEFKDQPALQTRVKKLLATARDELAQMQNGSRHSTGGGWVAAMATVAPTAYVGPNAMVLGNACVSDNAIIEDYAIVAGDAVVSGHARVSGSAIVKDNAKVDGYSRTWASLGGSDEASVVPIRHGAKALNTFGLWANYAMDREEKDVLEDWYRFPFGADRGYGSHLGLNLNGYLYGQPVFATDGPRQGYRFNGKNQSGELSQRLADLGEITVDLAVKWEGSGEQTIFDFGSSTDNCFVLKISLDGKPELVATVDGTVVARAAADKKLPPNTWTRLRVEIDGTKTSLWMDDTKVAETATRFRPCDAFPAGKEKRNTIAASRTGSNYFNGCIDYVVVYHTVHDDFSAVPEPVRDSPIRPTTGFIADVEKILGNVEMVNKKIDAEVNRRMAEYEKIKAQKDARERELLLREPDFVKAEADLAAAKTALENHKRELAAEFNALPDNLPRQKEIDSLRKQADILHKQIRELENECFTADETLVSFQSERKKIDEQRRTIEQNMRNVFDKQADIVKLQETIASLQKKTDKPESELKKLRQELYNKFSAFRGTNTVYLVLESNVRKLNEKIRDRQETLRDELRASNPVMRKKQKLDRKLRELENTLRNARDMYTAKGTAEDLRTVSDAEAALAAATEKAMLPYMPEKFWLFSFNWQGYGGYYNTPYKSYMRDHVKALIGGGEMRENLSFLVGLQKAVTSTRNWHTTVDWDWRTKWEKDGSIEDLPLTKKWLARVRGPVVTDKPSSIDPQQNK
jgi:hypothetical protein